MSRTKYMPLGDVAQLQAGIGFPPSLQGRSYGDVPFLKVGDISRFARAGCSIASGSANYVSYEDVGAIGGKLIPAGSVLFAKIGEAIRQEFRVLSGCEVLVDNNVMAAIPSDKLDSRYFFNVFKCLSLYELATSTTVPSLRKSDLEKILVPVPELQEQKRIAAILDKADALRAKRRKALEHLDALAQAIFIEMFGEPVTNSKGLALIRLSEFGVLERGVSKHRPRNDPSLLGGRYPLIQTSEVANCDGYITAFQSTYSEKGLAQSRLWPNGTLCITIAANIAKAGILSFEACFPDSVVGFWADSSAKVRYVQFWLSFLQNNLERNAPASAQKNINLEVLRNLMIPLPTLTDMQLFESRLQQVERAKELMKSAHKECEALFSSLQHRAFRGEL